MICWLPDHYLSTSCIWLVYFLGNLRYAGSVLFESSCRFGRGTCSQYLLENGWEQRRSIDTGRVPEGLSAGRGVVQDVGTVNGHKTSLIDSTSFIQFHTDSWFITILITTDHQSNDCTTMTTTTITTRTTTVTIIDKSPYKSTLATIWWWYNLHHNNSHHCRHQLKDSSLGRLWNAIIYIL